MFFLSVLSAVIIDFPTDNDTVFKNTCTKIATMMNIMKTSLVGFFFLLALVVPANASAEDPDTAIQFLLDYVRQSDVVFIRNDKVYTPIDAAAHMQKKYAYYKDVIKTPEDFIRFAGTKSMISGSPYRVKTKTGEVMLNSAWLKSVLREYRLNPNPDKPEKMATKARRHKE